jgi:PAS domain S-box-containing protein
MIETMDRLTLQPSSREIQWEWNIQSNTVTMVSSNPRLVTTDEEPESFDAWQNRIHPDDRERVITSLLNAIREPNRHWSQHYRFAFNGKNYHEIFDRGTALGDINGTPLTFQGSMVDLSDFSPLIDALREKEERLRLAIESTELGIWDFNPQTGALTWSPRCKELFGIPKDVAVDYPMFLTGVHPDDRQQVNLLVERALANESNGSFETEYRTIGIVDRRLRWIRAKGKAYFDNDNRAYRFTGTVLDITKEKSQEYSLRISEERFRSIFDQSLLGIALTDVNGRFLQTNGSFNRITGYSTDELQSLDLFALTHPDDIASNLKSLKLLLQNEIPGFIIEKRYVRKDGSIVWVRNSVSSVKDASGFPKNFIAASQDITSERSSNEEQRKLVALVENSGDFIAMANLNQEIIFANPAGRWLVAPENTGGIEGRRLTELFFEEDVQMVETVILKNVIKNGRWSGELRFRHLNTGEEIPVFSNWFRIDDPATGMPMALATVTRDLREQKAAESVIRESVESYKFLAESMPQKVWTAEADGTVNYANNHWLAYAGMSLYEMKEWGWVKLVHPDDLSVIHSVVENSISKGRDFEVESRFRKHDGTYRWHLTRGLAQKDENGTIIGWVGTNTDIDDQKKVAEHLEAMVKERTHELVEANKELERSNHDLEQFAYVASHDLQEPLRKIITFADLLIEKSRQTADPEIRTYVDKITGSAERMTRLIKDLLDYSRLQSKDQSFVQTDLNEILKHVLTDFEVAVQTKNAVITADSLPVIEAIPLQMSQLFHNLISNALKFSSDSRQPEVRITSNVLNSDDIPEMLDRGARYYRITVTDNGIGFNQNFANQIFIIFQRLNDRRKFAGTGIGLAICRKIVTSHHGEIIAESSENAGASFHIFLPAAQPMRHSYF